MRSSSPSSALTALRTPASLTLSARTTTRSVSPDWAGNRSPSRLCACAESEPGAEESFANSPPKAADSPKAMAREVHDTVAHAIAIINVQAGVTAYLLDKRPERAREALLTIERTSAQALHEMRAVLGVLRDPDNGRLPHPGLAQAGTLTAMARDAGLDITLEMTPAGPPLPSAVDHTAYRILQESITNVIRHVGPTRVSVALDRGADALEVRVTDEGGQDARAD